MVVWDDSYELHGWQPRGKAPGLKPVCCVSVGLLLKKTRKRIVLALSVSDDQAQGVTTIPRRAVRHLWKLNDPTDA